MMLGILKTLGKHFILSLDRRLEDSETLQMAPWENRVAVSKGSP